MIKEWLHLSLMVKGILPVPHAMQYQKVRKMIWIKNWVHPYLVRHGTTNHR